MIGRLAEILAGGGEPDGARLRPRVMRMTTLGARLWAVAVPLALVACGTTTFPIEPSGGGGGAAGGDADAGTAAIRVDQVGGFITPEYLATRLPVVAVYADGRVIDEGPQIAIAPGPALPNLQLRRISPEDVQALVDRAIDAGVGEQRDFGEPGITDVTTTRFTVRTEDGVRRTEVYALTESEDSPGLTAEQRRARRDLRQLVEDLTDLPGTLGADAVSESAPYTAAAVAGFATPCGPAPDEGAGDPCAGELADPNPRPWPGAPLPGQQWGEFSRLTCALTTGDAAATLLAEARTAVTTTTWTYDNSRWRVSFRPLLPDETRCADLPAPK